MYILSLLILAASALAIPTSSTPASTLAQLSAQTRASDICTMPAPGNNCAGAAMKDVIVQYDKASKEQRDLILGAVKSSGATIAYDYKDFGFSGMVPGQIVDLIQAHGKTFDLKVFENACAEIPWCGEAPC